MPTEDSGFTLIELVVCVALLVMGAVVALGTIPVLARASAAGIIRTAAADVARNALERARAAAAYAPPAAVTNPAGRVATAANHAWVLAPSASYGAAARITSPLCRNAGGLDVPLVVSTAYDAGTDLLTVSVAYPSDPCDPSSPSATVAVAATLMPAAYAPGTLLPDAIGDPQRQ